MQVQIASIIIKSRALIKAYLVDIERGPNLIGIYWDILNKDATFYKSNHLQFKWKLSGIRMGWKES